MRKSFLLLLPLLALGFTAHNPPDKNAIRCFRLTFSVPLMDKQGKFLGNRVMNDTRTFVCGDLVMFIGKAPHLVSSTADARTGMRTEFIRGSEILPKGTRIPACCSSTTGWIRCPGL